MEVRQIGNVMPTKSRDNPNQGRVYSTDGLCPALTKMDGGGETANDNSSNARQKSRQSFGPYCG